MSNVKTSTLPEGWAVERATFLGYLPNDWWAVSTPDDGCIAAFVRADDASAFAVRASHDQNNKHNEAE